MSDIDHVIAIAREAGEILKRQFQEQKYTVKTKTGPDDYVTSADLASDAHIRKRLTEMFPNDKIFSEEEANQPTDFSGRVWIVDPLDGTASFVDHDENFTVIIGLCEDGKPTLGVVVEPLSGAVFYAEKNKGAWIMHSSKKEKIQVNRIGKMSDARILVEKNKRAFPSPLNPLIKSLPCKAFVTDGDGMAGNVFCLVASGKAECRIHSSFRLCKWDTCGSQVIVEEAGGKVTDIDGNPLNYAQKEATWGRSVVATNGLIHDEIIEQLQKELKRR